MCAEPTERSQWGLCAVSTIARPGLSDVFLPALSELPEMGK